MSEVKRNPADPTKPANTERGGLLGRILASSELNTAFRSGTATAPVAPNPEQSKRNHDSQQDWADFTKAVEHLISDGSETAAFQPQDLVQLNKPLETYLAQADRPDFQAVVQQLLSLAVHVFGDRGIFHSTDYMMKSQQLLDDSRTARTLMLPLLDSLIKHMDAYVRKAPVADLDNVAGVMAEVTDVFNLLAKVPTVAKPIGISDTSEIVYQHDSASVDSELNKSYQRLEAVAAAINERLAAETKKTAAETQLAADTPEPGEDDIPEPDFTFPLPEPAVISTVPVAEPEPDMEPPLDFPPELLAPGAESRVERLRITGNQRARLNNLFLLAEGTQRTITDRRRGETQIELSGPSEQKIIDEIAAAAAEILTDEEDRALFASLLSSYRRGRKLQQTLTDRESPAAAGPLELVQGMPEAQSLQLQLEELVLYLLAYDQLRTEETQLTPHKVDLYFGRLLADHRDLYNKVTDEVIPALKAKLRQGTTIQDLDVGKTLVEVNERIKVQENQVREAAERRSSREAAQNALTKTLAERIELTFAGGSQRTRQM